MRWAVLRKVLDSGDIERSLRRVAHEILERNRGSTDITLVGVHTRGVPLAARLRDSLDEFGGTRVPLGTLDIGLYRDDLDLRPKTELGPTEVPTIDEAIVVLVDDVLYTGRTSRASLDALADLGRPRAIQLAVLVDRGHRELPIRADYVGKNIPTSPSERVMVRLMETDNEEEQGVWLEDL